MKKLLKNILLVFTCVFLICGMFSFSARVRAEDAGDENNNVFPVLLKDIGAKTSASNIKQIKLNLSDNTTDILYYTECTNDPSRDTEYFNTNCVLRKDDVKTIYYANALKYGDKLIDIELKFTRTSDPIRSDYYRAPGLKTEDVNHIVKMSNNRIRFYGMGEYNTVGTKVDNRNSVRSTVEVVTSFYYNNQPFRLSGFLGFIDPDGADYYFDNSMNRNLIYANGPLSSDKVGRLSKMFDEIYVVDENGIHRNDSHLKYEDQEYWDNVLFAIELNDESSLKVTYDMASDYIILPTFFSLSFQIEYDLNDSDGPAAINPEENLTFYQPGQTLDLKNPTREGYTFLGWDREDTSDSNLEDKIVSQDRGDKKFTATWIKTSELPINTYTVEDRVIGGGEINLLIDGEKVSMPSITVDEGESVTVVTNPLEGFKIKKLLSDDENVTPVDVYSSEFTYTYSEISDNHSFIAEYEPFTYTIKYDANGGEGIMEPSRFVFTDETFMSKENVFAKAGEKFIGFKLEGREELIIFPEDFKALLVEMGDGAEITLVAQWNSEQTTKFIDIDTEEELLPEEIGQVEPKDIANYVYIETEADPDGNWVHKYKAVKTNYVDEEGTMLLEPKPGKQAPEDIPNYKLVRTEDNPKGDRTHIYHKVITSWVDETGKALHPSEVGALDPKVFPNYKLVKSEVKDNGDTVHTYHHIQTSWVDEKGEKIVQSKPGEHPKETFPNYEFVRTETKTNGDVVHHYHKLVNLKFVVDGKTVKDENIKRGADGVAPEVLPKNGYKFVGWDKEFKNIQVDTVVTAKLEPIKYPITYVLDGGKNDDANPSSYTIEDAVTLKNPIKLGAKFLGWKEGNTIAKGSTGAKTFTAQWEVVTPPVNTGYNPALIEFATIISSSLAGLYVAIKKKNKK